MTTTTLRKAQSTLAALSSQYHGAIPLDAMFDACRAAGLNPVQEDGTPWAGVLCGREGRATIALADSRKCLQLSWHKMEVTGRYEVTAYIS
jgi:hypothetical protein